MAAHLRLLVSLAVLTGAAPALAQSGNQDLDQYHYTEAINALLKGHPDQAGLADPNYRLLGLALRARATAVQDALDLMVTAGLDYHAMLDTLKLPVRLPLKNYFAARFLYQAGKYRDALARFEKTALEKQLPAAYQNRCLIWSGACLQQLQRPAEARKAWEQAAAAVTGDLAAELAYARWKSGDPGAGAAVLQPKTPLWQLWQVAVGGDLARSHALYNQLWAEWTPAEVIPISYTQGGRAVSYTLSYYDPAKLEILAYADWSAAADAFSRLQRPEQRPAALLYAASCALQAGRLAEAKNLLAGTSDAKKGIYAGAIARLEGRAAEAEKAWAPFIGASSKGDIWSWFDAVAHLPDISKLLKERSSMEAQKIPKKMDEALSLGRALLLSGQPEKAYTILNELYPRQFHNNPEEIKPSYLLVFGHAKFKHWRTYQTELLGHIVCLNNSFPASKALLEMMQLVMVPDKIIEQTQTQ